MADKNLTMNELIDEIDFRLTHLEDIEMDNSDSIPTGVTIYGRWTSINLAGGRVIAYFGK